MVLKGASQSALATPNAARQHGGDLAFAFPKARSIRRRHVKNDLRPATDDEPAGTDNTVATNEDVDYTFTAGDFGFTDPNDTPANALAAVRITTLPAAGSLTLSGSGFAAGTEVAVADITAGNLDFTPAAGASGTPYASFTFQVRDDGGTANGGVDVSAAETFTITVNPVNDAPVFTLGPDPVVGVDAGPQNIPGFITKIAPGPASAVDEAGQALTTFFRVTGTTGGLTFTQAPSIDFTTGALTFTSAPGSQGTATIEVTVSDDGGTANGLSRDSRS